jgi:hypothetical protein
MSSATASDAPPPQNPLPPKYPPEGRIRCNTPAPNKALGAYSDATFPPRP